MTQILKLANIMNCEATVRPGFEPRRRNVTRKALLKPLGHRGPDETRVYFLNVTVRRVRRTPVKSNKQLYRCNKHQLFLLVTA